MNQTISRKQPLMVFNRRVVKIRRVKLNITEPVACWLESEDTDAAKAAAYGVCLMTGIFLSVKILQTMM